MTEWLSVIWRSVSSVVWRAGVVTLARAADSRDLKPRTGLRSLVFGKGLRWVAVAKAVELLVLLLWARTNLAVADPELQSVAGAKAHTATPAAGATMEIPEEPLQVEKKSVSGQLVMIRKNAISVEYDQKADGAYEMLLPLGKKVQFEHVKGLDGLQRGDTVTVEYHVLSKTGPDGKPAAVKTLAAKITLVKQASDAMRSTSAGAP